MAQPGSVLIEDGSELTQQAWQNLRATAGLRIQPILDFVRDADQHRTSLVDRQALLDQAALMFDHLYPHMPFKAELYQLTHPSDYLRAKVQPALESLSETDFHAQMIAAFSLVRDAHSLYGLPSPYRGAVAFLPFEIRPYLDSKLGWRFFVISVMAGFPALSPGAEIVGWGDLSALDHVERTEGHLPGGNFFASLTRAAIHATLRPLTFVQLPFPDELPEVTLHYKPAKNDQVRTIRVPWAVATGFSPGAGFPSSAFSISPAAMMSKQCGKILHGGTTNPWALDAKEVPTLPAIFSFSVRLRRSGRPAAAGCAVRLRAHPGVQRRFLPRLARPNGWSREFRRIVDPDGSECTPDGLVIDIRGNPGGDVQAAEQMLQMLTPKIIEPAHFHLANTATVLSVLQSLNAVNAEQLSADDSVKLSEARAELEAWVDDAGNTPLPHGSPLTSGRTLTDAGSANAIGQIYHGRGVALLIDSLTYSAADIFAAGFQDSLNRPGFLGTSLLTGGGGANVWSHQDLVNKLGPKPGVPIAALPGDASMSLAIRRCSRVGPFKGQPVEDKGVQVDSYYLTDGVDDLVADNPGILRLAGQQFRGRAECRVDAGAAVVNPDGSVTLKVQTKGVGSLKFFLNGHLAREAAVGAESYTVPPVAGIVARVLRVEGYSSHHVLLRARTIHMEQPVALGRVRSGHAIDHGRYRGAHVNPGDVISRYRIISRIGKGGMGEVYRAEDTRLEREEVALKFLPQDAFTGQSKSRFLNEARAAAKARHPSICPIHDIEEADGELFLVMAYIDGETLRNRIARRPFDPAQTVDLAIQIAGGLACAHALGIVHRDIKSGNIMLDSSGHASILDFGLALMPEAMRLTEAGAAVGTPAYMSPGTDRGARSGCAAPTFGR